jgi:WD40 repeat protein
MFEIRSVPAKGTPMEVLDDFPVVCCGTNDGRFGRTLRTMSDINPRLEKPFRPAYIRAVVGYQMLCIASERVVDIHDVRTGRRMTTIPLPRQCRDLKLSPNEKILAVTVYSPSQILLFPTREIRDQPLWSTPLQDEFVNCIAFTPTSTHLCICYSNGVIETYDLDSDSLTPTPRLVSKFDRKVQNKGLYNGVKDVVLYDPHAGGD